MEPNSGNDARLAPHLCHLHYCAEICCSTIVLRQEIGAHGIQVISGRRLQLNQKRRRNLEFPNCSMAWSYEIEATVTFKSKIGADQSLSKWETHFEVSTSIERFNCRGGESEDLNNEIFEQQEEVRSVLTVGWRMKYQKR
jgi:hypothetical protein